MKLQKGIALICVLAVGTVASWARTEPGSFITKLCASTSALVAHVRAEPKVMDRYMRHFAMTDRQVVQFISGLRLTRTTADALYVVYGVPESGLLRSKLLKVKSGTKVFVDAAGSVVLLWHCGNPVTRGPSVPYTMARPVAEPTGIPSEELRDVPVQAPVPTMEGLLAVAAEPAVPSIPVVPTIDVPPVGQDIPIVTGGPSAGILSFLPVLGLVTTGGGGGGNVIPEPASLAAVGIGFGALLARRRRK